MIDSGSQPTEEYARWSRLTEKQRACLDLLLDRQTSKQIARRLDISKQAVDLRLTTARDILGAANRDETALIYARLRQTYDRIPCDPVILPPHQGLVPSHFPDGDPPNLMELHDGSSVLGRSSGKRPPFRGLWRRDHGSATRVWIYLGGLALTVWIFLGGLGIAQALNQLLSH